MFTNQDDFPGVLENVSPAVTPRTTLRLSGSGCNRDAIGGIIRSGDSPVMTRFLTGGGSYLSTSSFDQSVSGIGAAGDEVRVTWPGSTTPHSVRIRQGKLQLLRPSPADPQRVDVFLIPD